MKILMAYDTLYMLVIHICSGVRTSQDKFGIENIQSFIYAGPLAHPIRPEAYIEINNFYTLTVYEKGAEVVRMIRCSGSLVGGKFLITENGKTFF
jgi:hypothetical protein